LKLTAVKHVLTVSNTFELSSNNQNIKPDNKMLNIQKGLGKLTHVKFPFLYKFGR